ncbi:MAG: hydroxymethylbilane synthase [Bacteroidota bacterium]
MVTKKIIVGTRGSKLALTQSGQAIRLLEKLNPGVIFEFKIIKTSGDKGNISQIGAFVREIETELLNGEIDIAIHSLKDLPSDSPAGLLFGAIPERVDVREALIAPLGITFDTLPLNAKIGTGSLRRIAQLKQIRPDLEFVHIQGNVDTRISKVDNGDVNAIILAHAGLHRLDMSSRVNQLFTIEELVPAVGQGALAIQVRESDESTKNIVGKLDHLPTRKAVEAEREYLKIIGGGCKTPYAAYAILNDDSITIKGVLSDETGNNLVRGNITGPINQHLNIAAQLVASLRAKLRTQFR